MKKQKMERVHKEKLAELKLELPTTYKTVACPACDSAIPAVNLNIHDKIGKCDSCNVLFPLAEEIAEMTNTLHLPAQQNSRQELLRPEGIEIFRYKDEIDFTFSQSYNDGSAALAFLMPLMAIFATFVFFRKDIALWIPVVMWGVALLSIIGVIFRATIRVSINEQKLSITRRPKKLSVDESYDVKDISQVYIKKNGDGVFSVWMLLNSYEGQKHVQLIDAMDAHSKALYIEQQIEKYLRIADREVPEASGGA